MSFGLRIGFIVVLDWFLFGVWIALLVCELADDVSLEWRLCCV